MSTIFFLLCQFHFWNDSRRLEASACMMEKAVSKIIKLCSINSIAVRFSCGTRFSGLVFQIPGCVYRKLTRT
jgi:hypothetical protein